MSHSIKPIQAGNNFWNREISLDIQGVQEKNDTPKICNFNDTINWHNVNGFVSFCRKLFFFFFFFFLGGGGGV